eukprot:SAG11_NODE_18827_length_480_cov_0.979003_1_plen_62_part_00
MMLANGPDDGVDAAAGDEPGPDIDMFDDGEPEAPVGSQKRRAADKDGVDGVDMTAIQCVSC